MKLTSRIHLGTRFRVSAAVPPFFLRRDEITELRVLKKDIHTASEAVCACFSNCKSESNCKLLCNVGDKFVILKHKGLSS